MFRRATRELDVPFLTRWIMWAAVRLGGRLADTTPREVGIWLLVTVPSVAFLLTPGLVVLLFLALFWLVELVTYAVLKPATHSPKKVNPPRFRLGHVRP